MPLSVTEDARESFDASDNLAPTSHFKNFNPSVVSRYKRCNVFSACLSQFFYLMKIVQSKKFIYTMKKIGSIVILEPTTNRFVTETTRIGEIENRRGVAGRGGERE